MRLITLTLRRLQSQNTGILLGMAGLVVGLACVLYILIWGIYEVGYDRYNQNLSRMFVVHAYLEGEGANAMQFAGCPPMVAPTLVAEYPEVQAVCRYIPPLYTAPISRGSVTYVDAVALADFSIFDIFTFPFVQGNAGLQGNNNRVVLSQQYAIKYFGTQNPVGQSLLINKQIEATVVGVIADIPRQSTLSFDIIMPIENVSTFFDMPNALDTWYNNGFFTVGLLHNSTGFDKVASTITRRLQQEVPESTNYLRAYRLADRYLYEQGNIDRVYVYGIIGLLVLITAILNFVNLFTARSVKQGRETGVRKTLGATRRHLIGYYYLDVGIICTLAFGASLVLALACVPVLNQVLGVYISYRVLLAPIPMGLLLVVLGITILLAGSYPALYFSSLSPKAILSGGTAAIRSKGWFRNSLIVVMFVVSTVLLSSTYMIWRQSQYLLTMDLGYAKEQLLYINLSGEMQQQTTHLEERLLQIPEVMAVSGSTLLPTHIGWNSENWTWEGKDPDQRPLISIWPAEYNLLATLGAQLIEGNMPTPGQHGVIINEALARIMGWDSYTGKVIAQGNEYTILGVVRNITFNSVRDDVQPMVIIFGDNVPNNYLLVRAQSQDMPAVVRQLTHIEGQPGSEAPLEYGFVANEVAQQLKSNTDMGRLVAGFTLFALLVLALGLLGVVMFLIEQKVKEIGIRKCLGQEPVSILWHIVRPFAILGAVATLIAAPLGWYIMHTWLQHYARHIELNPLVFVGAGVVVTALALLVIGWQSWRVATANPVEAIRRG